MPPTRNQVHTHPTNNTPYQKDRASTTTASHSRQSSSGTGTATGSTATNVRPPVKLERSADDVQPRARPDQDNDEAARRERKKRKRNAKKSSKGAEDDSVATAKLEEDGKPLKLQSQARPLSTSTGINTTPSQLNKPNSMSAITAIAGNTKPSSAGPPLTKAEARLLKLEQRTERYKNKLKEGEARAAKDAERTRQDAEMIMALEAKLKEQESVLRLKEEEAKGVKQTVDDHLKAIEGHVADKDHVKETLQEAVSCLICSDTLHDPHILSCGHIACRDCLKAWFRQPNAYKHDVGGNISTHRDMSYRSKVCHVCRSIVLRRPTRMYNLYSFLEPLGIISGQEIPTASQPPPPPAGAAPNPTAAPSASSGSQPDPWALSFPPDKSTYRLHDEEDDTYRCPSCLHEIYQNVCDHCDAEFSGDDEEDEFEAGGFGLSDIDEEEGEGVNAAAAAGGAGQRGAARRAAERGLRRARVDIATIEEYLGGEGDDGAPQEQLQFRLQGMDAIPIPHPNETYEDMLTRRAEERRAQRLRGNQPEEESDGGDISESSDGSHGNMWDLDPEYAARRRARRNRVLGIQPATGPGGINADPIGSGSESGSESEAEGRLRRRRIPGGGHRPGRHHRDPIDIADTDEDIADLHSEMNQDYISSDSESDDGALSRTRTFIRNPAATRVGALGVAGFSEEDEIDMTEESEYGGSFIDDEGDGLSVSTQHEHDDDVLNEEGEESDEVRADEMIGRAREEDEEEEPLNIQDLRRRRLEALIHSRSSGRVRPPPRRSRQSSMEE